MNAKTLAYAVVIGALILWRLYRRLKAHTTPQDFQPSRLGFTTAFLLLILGWLSYSTLRQGVSSVWILSGAAAGLALGWLGLRLTRFDFSAQPRRYTPNLYLGSGITLLMAGRLLYSLSAAYTVMRAGVTSPAALTRSPATAALALLSISFYATYSLLVLLKFNSTAAPTVDSV